MFFSALLAFVACASADDEGGPVEQSQQALGTTPDTWRPPPPPANPRPDPLAALEEVRSHETDPWVRCPATTREVATDPLGPVISHGFLEAPGYRQGVIDSRQARFLRRSRLRWLPLSEGFFLEDVVLPSAQHPRAAVLHAVNGALRIAGWSPSGEAVVTREQEHPRRDGLLAQRVSWISFTHQGVPIQGHSCRLQVASTGEASGTLACWLPRQPLTVFEPFRVSQREAEEAAKRMLRFRGGRVLSKQIYLTGQPPRGQAPVGLARTVVILYDGKAEWQVEVDGEGGIVSRQRTERGFRFLGYPLDYQEGLQEIETSIGVHPTQHAFLDSAPLLEGDKNCVLYPDKYGEIPQDTPYQTGMVVCENEAFTTPDLSPDTKYGPRRTLPRKDRDHTNPPSNVDPFGFQKIALRTVPGSNFVAPAIPFLWTSAEGNNWRGTSSELVQVAQGGWAELQAFQTIGKRATFYKSFPSHLASSPVGTWGPGSRLEIFVHQFEDRDDVRLSFPSLETTFTGLNSIRFGAISGPGTAPAGGGQHVFDVLADGSISAHEFHHHIQFVNQFDVRGTLVRSEDMAVEAEGMADVFGAVAVGRSRVGLLANPTLEDPCLGEEFPLITKETRVRSACNRNTFPDGEKPHDKGAALFGAGYNYAKRLLDSGLGPASALFDLFDAEILFLASLTKVEKDENGDDDHKILCLEGQKCGIRRVLEGLILTLRSSDPLAFQPGQPANTPFAVRRRQHIALSSFAAKNMFLTNNNGTTCQAPSGVTFCKEAALRTLSVSSVLRWNEGDPIPFFEVFTPSGTAYEHTVEQDPEGIRHATKVTFEFAQDVAFTNPLTYQQFAPRPKNNSPNGSFRYVPTPSQWQILQTAGTSTEDRRLYFRVKVCMAEAPSECVYSSEGIAQGAAPFLQFGPGAPPGGCTCRVGQPTHAPAAPLSLVGLLAAVLLRRRRNVCP